MRRRRWRNCWKQRLNNAMPNDDTKVGNHRHPSKRASRSALAGTGDPVEWHAGTSSKIEEAMLTN